VWSREKTARSEPVSIEAELATFFEEKARKAQVAAKAFFWSTVALIMIGGVALWIVPAALATFDRGVLERERISGRLDVYLDSQQAELEKLFEWLRDAGSAPRLIVSESVPLNVFHRGPVSVVATASDGRTATFGWDRTVRIQTPTGEARTFRQATPANPTAMTIAGNGTMIVGHSDGTVERWSLDGRRKGPRIVTRDGAVSSITAAPGGEFVTGSSKGILHRWSADGKLLASSINGHDDWINAIAVAPDGSIVSASDDGSVRRWQPDLASSVRMPIFNDDNYIPYLAVTPTNVVIAVMEDDNQLLIWEGSGTPKKITIGDRRSYISALYVTRDGVVVVGTDDGNLRWLDQSWKPIGSPVPAHKGGVWALAENPNGDILSGGDDGFVRKWSKSAGELSSFPAGHRLPPTAIAVSASGRIVTGGRDGTIRFWKSDGQLDKESESGHDGAVTVLRFAKNGDVLSGGGDGRIFRWDNDAQQTGEPLTRQRRQITVPSSKKFGTAVATQTARSTLSSTFIGAAISAVAANPEIFTFRGRPSVSALGFSEEGGAPQGIQMAGFCAGMTTGIPSDQNLSGIKARFTQLRLHRTDALFPPETIPLLGFGPLMANWPTRRLLGTPKACIRSRYITTVRL
jgi:WD40 repeat protein